MLRCCADRHQSLSGLSSSLSENEQSCLILDPLFENVHTSPRLALPSLHHSPSSSSLTDFQLAPHIQILAFHFRMRNEVKFLSKASESSMQSMPPNLPVGWRFQPTNEELLDHYLKKKRLGQPIDGFDIQDIQICDFDPWELLDEKSRDKERYLFCLRQFHLKTRCTQRKRKAKAGYWKRTGEIQRITLEDSEEVIGTKKIFVYHNPKPTEYVKHEFEYTAKLDSPTQADYDFVLCKLMIIKKKKASKKAKKKKVEPVSKKKEAKKSKNIEVVYEKANPNKKARKGLPYCDTASVSVAGNRKQGKIMANSTFGEGEPSNHKTSDIEYQNPSTRMVYSTIGEGGPSYHNNSDFEYQNPSDRKAYSACGEGEPSYHNTCDFENQNPSDRKAYPACGEGEPINHMTSDFEDQSPDPMTMNLTCRKGDSSHQAAFDYGYQNTYEMSDIPNYNIGDRSFLLASDLNNQTPKEINDSDVSRYNLGETSGLLAANLDNQNPNEMTCISSYEVRNPGCPSFSWVENQNSCERTIVSTHKKGETSSFTNFDFEDDRNQSKVISDSCNGKGKLFSEKTDISASVEGCEKTDMSYSEYCWSDSLASGVQETEYQEAESHYKKTDIPNLDDVGEATFPEIDSQILDELTASDDLLDTLCSEATKPIDTNESLN